MCPTIGVLPNDVLPEGLNWMIQEGYIRTATYSSLSPIAIQCINRGAKLEGQRG